MAKRRRLGLPGEAGIEVDPPAPPLREPRGMFAFGSAPIARIAGEASATAALEGLADEMARARAEGRLVQALPLAEVQEGWLLRDRLSVDPDDLASLVESLRAHGQRTAIEVVDRGAGAVPRYGLISGWRRLAALRQLLAETADPRFATVLAVLRRPETAGDAYVAMVEENEIRAGLSYYERARIAALAVEAGVFETVREALKRLYASASRARRSKIGSFLTLHEALGPVLRAPEAIPERLGLALAMRIEADPAFATRLRRTLEAASPATAEAERALLMQALKPEKGLAAAAPSAPPVTLVFAQSGQGGEIRLTGPGVTEALRARLERWLGQG